MYKCTCTCMFLILIENIKINMTSVHLYPSMNPFRNTNYRKAYAHAIAIVTIAEDKTRLKQLVQGYTHALGFIRPEGRKTANQLSSD